MLRKMLAEFDARAAEVELYFSSILAVEKVSTSGGSGLNLLQGVFGVHPDSWIKIHKTSGYLVLYNLVEFAMTIGFETLFGTIRSERVAAPRLSEPFVKQLVLRNLKTVSHADGSPAVYCNKAAEILQEAVKGSVASFPSTKGLFSGNVDEDLINSLCESFGMEMPGQNPARKGASHLKDIKNKRNGLAHGNISFSQVNITAGELERTRKEVSQFLRFFLEFIEDFCQKQQFLR